MITIGTTLDVYITFLNILYGSYLRNSTHTIPPPPSNSYSKIIYDDLDINATSFVSQVPIGILDEISLIVLCKDFCTYRNFTLIEY